MGAGRWLGMYLRQDVLLVVRFILQGLSLRGSHGLGERGLAGSRGGFAGSHRGLTGSCGGLAGSRGGRAGRAAWSHTQSQAQNQQQRLGHGGGKKGLGCRRQRRRSGSGATEARGSLAWSRKGALRVPSPAGCSRARQAGAPRTARTSPSGVSSPNCAPVERDRGKQEMARRPRGGGGWTKGSGLCVHHQQRRTWGRPGPGAGSLGCTGRPRRLLGAEAAQRLQGEGGASIVRPWRCSQ